MLVWTIGLFAFRHVTREPWVSLPMARLNGEEEPDRIYSSNSNSRRAVLLWGGASAVYSKFVYDKIGCVSGFERGPRPLSHEERLSSTFARAVRESWQSRAPRDEFRILEVGIGPAFRTLTNGAYEQAWTELGLHDQTDSVSKKGTNTNASVRRVTLTGLDVPSQLPSSTDLTRLRTHLPPEVELQLRSGNLEHLEDDDDNNGQFDVVLCSFVLCSVNDPLRVTRELKRLLRKPGGTFGYVEHVAALTPDDGMPDPDHVWLERQQQWLDPLQNRLADNCHLHRSTERTIETVFGEDVSVSGAPTSYELFQKERFYVDEMWPVSCQACGVVKVM